MMPLSHLRAQKTLNPPAHPPRPQDTIFLREGYAEERTVGEEMKWGLNYEDELGRWGCGVAWEQAAT